LGKRFFHISSNAECLFYIGYAAFPALNALGAFVACNEKLPKEGFSNFSALRESEFYPYQRLLRNSQ
jgi:hypothetical protein